METFRAAEVQDRFRLTKLYSDVKRQYRHAIPVAVEDESPEVVRLNRKFRIQKDRLVAWGLEWADNEEAPRGQGPIGASVERAGLTEVVSSVMENLICMIDEVEKMRARIRQEPSVSPSGFPAEKQQTWTESNISHYADLVKDITSAMDLLCSDLRRPKDDTGAPHGKGDAHSYDPKRADLKHGLSKAHEAFGHGYFSGLYENSQEVPLSALNIRPEDLILPEESPPPYDSFGMPCPVRIVGHLRRRVVHSDVKGHQRTLDKIPVLVEYASYDRLYYETNVPLPFTRLEQLASLLRGSQRARPSPLMELVGYFQDPSRPRIGLVYSLPKWACSQTGVSSQPFLPMQPLSLFDLLQAATKTQPTASAPITAPPLEERFRLASELVSSFACLLQKGLTHRDVNSSSVAFFTQAMQQSDSANTSITTNKFVRRPALISYNLFTEYNIDEVPENLQQNIYRHPDDPHVKGPAAANQYDPRFDMYGLALVLLEIGLWVPLAELYKEKYSLRDFALRLEKIWIQRLASKCGTLYMRAVHVCLQAGNDATSSPKALQATIEQMTQYLAKCCVLDDEDDDEMDEEEYLASLAVTDHKNEKRRESLDDPMSMSDSTRAPAQDGCLSQEAAPVTDDAGFETKAPTGAWPPNALYPDYEISSLQEGKTLNEANSLPPRFSFPQYPLSPDMIASGRLMQKRLCKIMTRILDPAESSSIRLEGFGETEHAARPTVCVMCTSTRKAYKYIRKNLQFDRDLFDLIIVNGKVVRSKASASKTRRSGFVRGADDVAVNAQHQTRPLCGASIGAWKEFEHLPPVSFGGIIMIDSEPFGLSVHHMLEQPEDGTTGSDNSDLARSSAPSKTTMLSEIASLGDDRIESPEGSDSDSDASVFSDLDDDDDDNNNEDDDNDTRATSACSSRSSNWRLEPADVGDTPGISPGSDCGITITQPALDDVADDFFPVEEDRDEDHLDSHTLGHLHASSGLRRVTSDGVAHEVDWALLKLNPERLQPRNVVPGGRRHCPQGATNSISGGQQPPALQHPVCRMPYADHEDLYPTAVAPADDLAGMAVHCMGRTSGLGGGRIGPVMEFVKLAGRKTWSESWTIHGDAVQPLSNEAYHPSLSLMGSQSAAPIDMPPLSRAPPPARSAVPTPSLGVPGDSGAWILDNRTGRVVGHVLAWNTRRRIAYLAPMEVLLKDIRKTLQARRVYLPGDEAMASFAEAEVMRQSLSRSINQHIERELGNLDQENYLEHGRIWQNRGRGLSTDGRGGRAERGDGGARGDWIAGGRGARGGLEVHAVEHDWPLTPQSIGHGQVAST